MPRPHVERPRSRTKRSLQAFQRKVQRPGEPLFQKSFFNQREIKFTALTVCQFNPVNCFWILQSFLFVHLAVIVTCTKWVISPAKKWNSHVYRFCLLGFALVLSIDKIRRESEGISVASVSRYLCTSTRRFIICRMFRFLPYETFQYLTGFCTCHNFHFIKMT